MDILNEQTTSMLVDIAQKFGAAALVIIVGAILARFLRRWVRSLMTRLTLTPSLENLFESLAFYGTWAAAAFLALAVAGVPVTSLIAAGSAASVVIGLALQQQLQDISNAVIFLLFKPFEPGDTIRSGAFSGTVLEIQPFSTTLVQADRQVVHVSNSELRKAGITNFTKSNTLRADIIFRLTYDQDLQRARAIMLDVMAAESRVLPDPAPTVIVDDLTETGVVMIARPFTAADDMWATRWDLREQIKDRLQSEGIQFALVKAVATGS